jgi:hypothetical protein
VLATSERLASTGRVELAAERSRASCLLSARTRFAAGLDPDARRVAKAGLLGLKRLELGIHAAPTRKGERGLGCVGSCFPLLGRAPAKPSRPTSSDPSPELELASSSTASSSWWRSTAVGPPDSYDRIRLWRKSRLTGRTRSRKCAPCPAPLTKRTGVRRASDRCAPHGTGLVGWPTSGNGDRANPGTGGRSSTTFSLVSGRWKH